MTEVECRFPSDLGQEVSIPVQAAVLHCAFSSQDPMKHLIELALCSPAEWMQMHQSPSQLSVPFLAPRDKTGIAPHELNGPNLLVFRGVMWRIFLRLLPLPTASWRPGDPWMQHANAPCRAVWEESLAHFRSEYSKQREAQRVNPRQPSSSSPAPHGCTSGNTRDEDKRDSEEEADSGEAVLCDPLSLDENSIWAQYHQQAHTDKEIRKDLERLEPPPSLFGLAGLHLDGDENSVGFHEHTDSVSALNNHEIRWTQQDYIGAMHHILFTWARGNGRRVGYRQGMHDILSHIMYVLLSEATTWKRHVQDRKIPCHGIFDTLLAVEYIEHDAFAIFDALLRKAGWIQLFEDSSSSSSGGYCARPGLRELCRQFFHESLPVADASLHKHLCALDVDVHTFGTRWFRLFFLREFPIHQVVELWDAFLADWYTRCDEDKMGSDRAHLFDDKSNDESEDDDTLCELPTLPFTGLVVSVACVMLMYLRTDLLEMDTTEVLRRLLRYPPVESVRYFVEKALTLCRSPLLNVVQLPKKPKAVDPRDGRLSSVNKAPTSACTSRPYEQRDDALVGVGMRIDDLLKSMAGQWHLSDPSIAAIPDSSNAQSQITLHHQFLHCLSELKEVEYMLHQRGK